MGVSMCLQIGYQETRPVHKIGLALSPFVILYQHSPQLNATNAVSLARLHG